VATFREALRGTFIVTEENGREFSFDFSSLLGLSIEKAYLSFSVMGPKSGPERISLLADGMEIFSSELFRFQKNYQIDLSKVALESLRDGELALKFLAPEGDYIVRHIALNIWAKEPAVAPVPIPASVWLFGSGLGMLLVNSGLGTFYKKA
jgi:hypothetical protein